MKQKDKLISVPRKKEKPPRKSKSAKNEFREMVTTAKFSEKASKEIWKWYDNKNIQSIDTEIS